ncbi:MAG: alpha/beta hydrolase [Litoreibacter sp.]|uniref:alpha/beta fold hydrolase n=1 Tax=Litoreibacter sp. TaxID=1969459 RepID=UPI00329709FA
MLKTAIAVGTACALLGSAAVVNKRIQSREVATLRDHPPEGQILDVNGTPVHVYVEGTGPDVILIHGAGANWKDFTFSLIPILKQNFRLIAIDRPAHGYTGRIKDRAGDIESLAEQADLIHAAAQMVAAKRPLVVGQSYGGAVALSYGLRYGAETSGLMIISGVSHPWPGKLDRWYRIMGSAVGRHLLTPVLSAFATEQRGIDTVNAVFAPDPAPQGYLEHIGMGLAVRPSQVRVNISMVNALLPQIKEQSKRYDELQMPVEILHGTADQTVLHEIHALPLSKQIKNAELSILDGIGHMPHHTATDEVVTALYRLAKHAGLQ